MAKSLDSLSNFTWAGTTLVGGLDGQPSIVAVRAIPVAQRQCPQAKVHRHLSLLTAVSRSALHQHGRITGMLDMRALRHVLALPGTGVHGRQYARAVYPGLREILRQNRNSVSQSAKKEGYRPGPNQPFPVTADNLTQTLPNLYSTPE